MSDITRNLTPPAVWDHFAQIAEIPRPSKNEARIAAYVANLAEKAGLPARQDATGNVVVSKPASKGRENSPVVVIQTHLDMVCEKNGDVRHDFEKDPIHLERSNGYITAQGTTLGSDNGIGVAAALAVMLDPSLEHGPLEFLFTVDEETGMTGAMGLRPDFLKGRILLNLDSEEEGSLYVGCAGGRDTILTFDIQRNPAAGLQALRITVKGLKGGHSGVEIHIGRGNAIKILARTLRELQKSIEIRLVSLEGGSKRNAIPREASAVVLIDPSDLQKATTIVKRAADEVRAEFATVDAGVLIGIENDTGNAAHPVRKPDQDRIIAFLHTLPHGVIAMSADIQGLVETSTNVATVHTTDSSVVVETSQRSSVSSALNNILDQVATLGAISGARVESSDGYPGWKPDLQSKALHAAKKSYHALYGKDPAVKAIHAGLECGLIGEKFSGMDMVSFGPTIEGAHSPDEKVDIATVQKFWDLLLAVLKDLSS